MKQRSFGFLLLVIASQAGAPLPAAASDAELVAVPILSARIMRIAPTSFPPDPDCLFHPDVTITREDPSVTIDIVCTVITVSIEQNKLVATREPPGSPDFSVEFSEIVIDVPESHESYVPLFVTRLDGNRFRPSSEDGASYGSGTRHPSGGRYTFPAISGEPLRFGRGSFFPLEADRNELLEVSARVPTSSFPDADGDGEADPTDSCPDTTPDSPVDSAGCSQMQFCGQFSLETALGLFNCFRADWMDDELAPWPRDCGVSRGPAFQCVPQ